MLSSSPPPLPSSNHRTSPNIHLVTKRRKSIHLVMKRRKSTQTQLSADRPSQLPLYSKSPSSITSPAPRPRKRKTPWSLRLSILAFFLLLWFYLNERFKIKLFLEQELSRTDGGPLLQRIHDRMFYTMSAASASLMHLTRDFSACDSMSRYDGGWNLCASALPPPDQPCVLYSFGIIKDTSFDFDFVRRHPHCTIYAFDPSIGRETGDDFHPRIKFFNIGLAGKAEPKTKKVSKTRELNGVIWKMMTLKEVMKMLGHERVDVLKMDIKGSEWEVLGDMVSSKKWVDVELWPVTQIVAEFHFSPDAVPSKKVPSKKVPSKKVLSKNAKNVKLLEVLVKGGYRVCSRDENRAFSYPISITVSDNPKEKARFHYALKVGFVHSAKWEMVYVT